MNLTIKSPKGDNKVILHLAQYLENRIQLDIICMETESLFLKSKCLKRNNLSIK